jgi:hypothetical protein
VPLPHGGVVQGTAHRSWRKIKQWAGSGKEKEKKKAVFGQKKQKKATTTTNQPTNPEQSNNRTIEQSNNRTIEQSNNRTIEQTNNRTIEQFNNPTLSHLIKGQVRSCALASCSPCLNASHHLMSFFTPLIAFINVRVSSWGAEVEM